MYLIYIKINVDEFDKRMKYLIENIQQYKQKDGVWTGLYAWTYKKKMVSKFLKFRNKKIYKVVEKDIDDDRLMHLLKHKYPTLKLYESYFVSDVIRTVRVDHECGMKPKDTEGMTPMVTTKFEFLNSTDYLSENIYEFLACPEIDYNFFTADMVKLLDILQYTFYYDNYYATGQRREYADYQAGFNLTPGGERLYADMMTNELFALFYLYSYSFFGKVDILI